MAHTAVMSMSMFIHVASVKMKNEGGEEREKKRKKQEWVFYKAISMVEKNRYIYFIIERTMI